MERALPGRYIDLIRDGVSPAELKAKGRVAVWSALVQTAMSAQARGWDQTEWAALVLAPNSYLGYQAKSKGKDRTLPDMQVVKQMDNAWEKTWELRTSRDPAWTPEQARIEALERAQVAAKAVEDLYVDLTHAERLVLAYAGEQTRLRGFTNVALPRQAIYGATGLGSTAVATALKGLATKGLLHLHRTGQRAKSAKYRRASIYTLADARSLTLFIRDLTAPLPAGPDDGLASVTPIRTLSHRPLPTPAHGARDLLGAGVDLGHDGYPALSQQLPPFESSAVLAAARCRRGLWCWRGSCRAPVRALVEVPRVQPTRDHGCRQPGRACLMDRAKGEGNDPKDTVAIGGGTYRSTGRLYIVLPYKTAVGKNLRCPPRRRGLDVHRPWR